VSISTANPAGMGHGFRANVSSGTGTVQYDAMSARLEWLMQAGKPVGEGRTMRYQDDLEMDLWRTLEGERIEVLTVISLGAIVVMVGLILLTVAMMMS
jgi:hypothetical protein